MIFSNIPFKMFPLLDRNLPHVEEKILSYLEPKGLATAMLVSKQWHQRAKPLLCEWYANNQRKNGDVPLQTAVAHGYDHLVAFYLQKKKINVNEISKKTGMNALIEAARCKRDQIAKMLLEREDIDVNMFLEDKLWQRPCTALQLAARYDRPGFVKLLVERMDTNVNTRGPFGHTALILAVMYGKVCAMEELLKHPMIDVNIEDDHGSTALTVAKLIQSVGAYYNEVQAQKVIEILEENGATKW